MNYHNLTIDFEEFIKYYVKQWKMNFLIIVITPLLFAVGTKVFGNEISVPHSEEYLHYEQELAWHEDYLEKSILMNLDPTSIHERKIFLNNVTNYELMKDYVTSLTIWEQLETDKDKTYISELITWEETKASIVVTLRTENEKESQEWADYLKEKINVFDPVTEVQVGAERVVVDEKLQEEHLRWYSRIYHVNSLLLESQAGFTIQINLLAAVVTGILVGGVTSIFVTLAHYMFKRDRVGK